MTVSDENRDHEGVLTAKDGMRSLPRPRPLSLLSLSSLQVTADARYSTVFISHVGQPRSGSSGGTMSSEAPRTVVPVH